MLQEEELLKDFSSSDNDKEITARLDENEEDGRKDDPSDIQTAKVMRALGNRDVLEHLASFLNNQDMGSFYETCQTVKTNMDELSLWRKRAQKLVKILGIRKNILKERGRKKRFDCKSEESAHFIKLCYSLIKDVKGQVERLCCISSRAQIIKAAYLAHNRMLGSLDQCQLLLLEDMDLASVPAEHLVALASCVTERVQIRNVSNCDLVSILDTVKCEWLDISRQTLSSEETRALVRAMESRVKVVILTCDKGDGSLDIRALTQYSGQGKCVRVGFFDDEARRYREELRSWAQKINWSVTDDGTGHYILYDPRRYHPKYQVG